MIDYFSFPDLDHGFVVVADGVFYEDLGIRDGDFLLCVPDPPEEGQLAVTADPTGQRKFLLRKVMTDKAVTAAGIIGTAKGLYRPL